VRSGGTPERGAAHPEKKSSHPNQPALWGPGWGTGAKRQVGGKHKPLGHYWVVGSEWHRVRGSESVAATELR